MTDDTPTTTRIDRRTTLRGLGALATGLALAGCGDPDTDNAVAEGNAGDENDDAGGGAADTGDDDQATATPASDDAPIEIVDHALETDVTDLARVTGTVRNTGQDEQPYVQVEARLFDDEGTRIGEGMDNMTDVPPDQTVEFDVQTTAEHANVEDYEVEAGTSL